MVGGTIRRRPQVKGVVWEVEASFVAPKEGEEERDPGPGGLRRRGGKRERRPLLEVAPRDRRLTEALCWRDI